MAIENKLDKGDRFDLGKLRESAEAAAASPRREKSREKQHQRATDPGELRAGRAERKEALKELSRTERRGAAAAGAQGTCTRSPGGRQHLIPTNTVPRVSSYPFTTRR